MRYLKLILWILTIVFVGYYFFVTLNKNWDQIIHLKIIGSSSDKLFLIALALCVYLVNSMSWHLINRSLGIKLSYFKNLSIWVLSNANRYIPGGIWQYAGRVYLANQNGVPKTIATACLQIEALLTLISGSIIVLLALYFHQLKIDLPVNIIGLFVIAALLFLFIFTNKKWLGILSGVIEKIVKKKIYLEEAALPIKWLPLILSSFLLQFIVDGSVLFFLGRNLFELSFNLLPAFVAIFAVSWIAGYLSFFAPSGLGIQEVTMTTLLSAFIPVPLAAVTAILFRLTLSLSEVVTVVVTAVARSRNML